VTAVKSWVEIVREHHEERQRDAALSESRLRASRVFRIYVNPDTRSAKRNVDFSS